MRNKLNPLTKPRLKYRPPCTRRTRSSPRSTLYIPVRALVLRLHFFFVFLSLFTTSWTHALRHHPPAYRIYRLGQRRMVLLATGGNDAACKLWDLGFERACQRRSSRYGKRCKGFDTQRRQQRGGNFLLRRCRYVYYPLYGISWRSGDIFRGMGLPGIIIWDVCLFEGGGGGVVLEYGGMVF